MWAVVGSALAARRGQAVIVALVALLASAALAAAPWYAVAATQRVGVAAVASTAPEERLLSVSRRLDSDEEVTADPIGEIRGLVEAACASNRSRCDLTAFRSMGSGFVTGELPSGPSEGGESPRFNLAYREDFCDQIAVTGDCPAAAGEVVLPVAVADAMGVVAGDELRFTQSAEEFGTVRVVGVYQVLDPTDPYWGDGYLVGLGSRINAERHTAFTALETLADYRQVTYGIELVAIPEAFATIDAATFEAGMEPALAELRRQEYAITTSELGVLLERITTDRRNVVAGVGVGVAVLLLFGWFTLVVLLRNAVLQIRGDVGWWRLHGAPSGRGWLSALGQSAVPLLGGAALGAAAGTVIGRAAAGTITGAEPQRIAVQWGLVLVAATVAGGLVAVVAAQVGTLRTPVRDLVQRMPVRRSRWRRSLVDVVLVALAAAAVGQALIATREPTSPFGTPTGTEASQPGLALLAPGLAVLAIALIAAWAVPPLVAWLAARALRAGRVAAALVAASMARRPGTHRLFALVAVAVALLTTALLGWDAAARTQRERAALESGADRVVTLAAVDSARLLAAVRAIDPTGTQAMAVVRRSPSVGRPATLAVDSGRLGVVASWRREYGGSVNGVAAALRPAAPEPMVVTGDRLELTAAGADPAGAPVHVRAMLRVVATGEQVEAVFGPLGERPDRFGAQVAQCTAGCRLVGFEVLGPEQADPVDPTEPYAEPAAGTTVDLSGLAPGESSMNVFADPARWRPALGPQELGPIITRGEQSVRLTIVDEPPANSSLVRDNWAFVLDAPAPLPVLAAGWRPPPTEEFRISPLIGTEVPAEIAGTSALVPTLGESGLVVDLEYAQRLVPFPAPGATPQVWLSASAPSSIVDDLRAAGLRPLRQESLSGQVGRLEAEGSAVAVRFQAAVAVVGLLLAAGALLLLAASERSGWATELAALRAQGVGVKVVRLVGYGGLVAVTGAATVVGLVAGVAGAVIARLLHPGFVDGWAVLPAASLRPYPMVGAVALTALVLGAVVLAAAVALIRRTKDQLS